MWIRAEVYLRASPNEREVLSPDTEDWLWAELEPDFRELRRTFDPKFELWGHP